jgi:hypothetical protein
MSQTRLHTFRVAPTASSPWAGSGPRFPFDMLRYDTCWPSQPHDVTAMSELTGPVNLTGLTAPTFHRWESFGWRVTSHGRTIA